MKYCSECGKELVEHAAFCMACGVSIQKENVTIKKNKQKTGLGIASLIIGVIAVFWAMIDFLGGVLPSLVSSEIAASRRVEEGYELAIAIVMFVAWGFPAIISSILALINRANNKNDFNKIGLILSMFALLLVLVSILIRFSI